MIAAGIDIGSQYARIAVLGTDGAPVLCPDQEQSNVVRTPSTVHIGDGVALVGASAEEVLEESPRAPAVRDPRATLGAPAAPLTDSGGRAWHGDALLAVLLKKLNRDVRAFVSDSISSVALAVPSYADEKMRRGLKDAALLAGLGQSTIVDSPVVAANYHAFLGGREQRLLVVDIGAGGHDCALVVKAPEGFSIAAHAGSTEHGSEAIDRSIVRAIADQFRDEHGVDILRDPANDIPLRQLAERIKLAVLGREDTPALRQTVLIGRRVVDLALARRHLVAVADRVLESLQGSLRSCLVSTSDPVDCVLLIGGGRQLHGVRRCLAEAAAGVPIVEREFAAVFGAALAADTIQGQSMESKSGMLVGDIGMRVWNAVKNAPDFRVLIPGATQLPAQQTITLYTRRPNQERLVLDLVKRLAADDEGESLATFEFGPFENMPKDHPVEIVVACDLDGIIKVTARDPQTRREISQYSSGGEAAGAERLARQRDLVASLSVNV